jgi:hypothetical protein
MERLKGCDPTVTPDNMLHMIFERMAKNGKSWATTNKCYQIFHRALKENEIENFVAKALAEWEKLLVTYIRKLNDNTYGRENVFINLDQKMHETFSEIYSGYIRKLATFKHRCRILSTENKNMATFVQALLNDDIFWIYENFDALVQFTLRV